MTTLHRDSWEQYAALIRAEAAEMKAENDQLLEALTRIHHEADKQGGEWAADFARETLEKFATANEEQG